MKDVDKVRMAGVGRIVSAGLLKRPAGAHLDAEFLAAFAENALTSADRERGLDHLSHCRDCRDVLFLAHPQAAEQASQVSLRKSPVTIFRWVAVAASVAVIGGGVFVARHELGRRPEFALKKAPVAPYVATPQGYVATNDQKASAPETREHAAASPMTTAANNLSGRAQLKHMTAKPQAKMQFDVTDQVRVSNAPVATAPQELPTRGRNETDSRDDLAAAPAPSQPQANKAQAQEVPKSMNEVVTVTAEAATVKVQATEVKPEEKKQVSTAGSNAALSSSFGVLVGGQPAGPVAQWSLSRKGELRRTFDQGNKWQKVTVNGTRSRFQAVSSSGPQVWVGGKKGILYHSADSGLTWLSVTPAAGGRQLTGDIYQIEFTDAQNGRVTTGDTVWMTTDGGQNWTVSNK